MGPGALVSRRRTSAPGALSHRRLVAVSDRVWQTAWQAVGSDAVCEVERVMGRWLGAVSLVAAVVTVSCSSSPEAASSEVKPATREGAIRYMIGLRAGSPINRAIGEALERDYAQAHSSQLVLVESASGAVETVESLQLGTIDFGLTLDDVSYLAFVGQLVGQTKRFDRLSGVAALDLAVVHLLVRRDSGIQQLSEVRGHRVATGPAGSETQFIAALILQATGLDFMTIRPQTMPFQQAFAALAEGRLDAVFLTAPAPITMVTEAVERGARLIAIEGTAIDELMRRYRFFRPTRIPRDAYAGHNEALRTIGIEQALLCRRDLDEAVVYEFTKRLFSVLPAVASELGPGRFSALEHAPETLVPLHPGAARYYRERELFP
jgi:TRAP transporter TAXI family solute receptor